MRQSIQQWTTADIMLRSKKIYRSPFEDVDVFGVFTAPSGVVLRVLGFWDGDDKWVVRFAPTEVGMWRYRIESTDPENADFTGEDVIECVPYTGNLAIYRHGFLKVSDDHDYLAYADDTPFFWLGDTHWTFATEERFDESNCPKYKSQFKACVDKRVAQKFTVYQCNFRDGKGRGIFGKSIDLMQETECGFVPNIVLFQRNIDPKMEYIAKNGLVTAVGYAWGYDMANNGLARYLATAKYTAARYGAYPVVWTLAGELPGYAGDLAENIRLWGLVAEECEKWSAYGNLQSAHLANSRPFPVIYQDKSWFDFAMSQAGHGDMDMAQTMYAEFKKNYKGHPILESEGAYEGAASGEYTSRVIPAAMMRRLAYLIMQSGGCGYTYGCNGIWELQWEAGVGGIGWGNMAWWDGLELPGADQLTFFRDFYESVNWARLKPLPDEKAETRSCPPTVMNRAKIFFTGDIDMRTVVGYFSETAMRTFVLRGLTAARYHACWFNPESGERTDIAEDIVPKDGVWEYDASGAFGTRQDRLLVLRAV